MSDDTAITESPRSSTETARIERRLTEQLQRSEAQVVELESVLTDMLGGHDTIQEDRDSTRLVVDSIREDVRRIRSALGRLAGGTYGQCVTCRSMIAHERLEAIPTTTHCTRCA